MQPLRPLARMGILAGPIVDDDRISDLGIARGHAKAVIDAGDGEPRNAAHGEQHAVLVDRILVRLSAGITPRLYERSRASGGADDDCAGSHAAEWLLCAPALSGADTKPDIARDRG